MTVFPEIKSLEDYENMSSYPRITNESVGTISTKYKVGLLDAFEDECIYGMLYYNGHGFTLKHEDGCATTSWYNKFRYCSVDDVDFKNLKICINDTKNLLFTDKNDFDCFYKYIDLLNEKTEYFINQAITKISNVFLVNQSNHFISTVLDDILNTTPESFFTEDLNYFIMLHHFTFKCDLTRKYVNFSHDETNEAYQILRSNRDYSASVSSIFNLIYKKAKKIQEYVKINDEYMLFYLFLTLKDKLIEKYSSIWENEYDNTYEPINFKTYIEYCAKECRITQNDYRSIFSLACFWLKHLDNQTDDIRDIVKRIKSITILKDCATIQNITYKSNTINNNSNDVKLTTSYEKLNKLIGLSAIKNDVNNMINLVKMQMKRKNQGLKAVPVSLHLVFTGNPGTGKTTIARILADIYKEIGVLSKGHLVEVDRSGLVAGYVGQTAIKTQEKINEALGGILFIDEAYTLVKEGQDFGQEAIDTILKAMEDHRDDFIVIVAGYTDLMQNFINSNPGLKSRFNKYIEFPDYSAEELVQIFYSMCNEYQYTLTSEADTKLKEIIFNMEKNKDDNFANARDVRNLFEMVITKQATRLSESNGNIMEIDACDFQ